MLYHFLDAFLSDFKWYRRKRGGTWYYVYCPDLEGGFQGSVHMWVRKVDNSSVVEKQESY